MFLVGDHMVGDHCPSLVDIHSLLRSKGFDPGADDEYYTVLDESKIKDKIRKSHKKYFKEAFNELHLKQLVEKSMLSFDSKDRAKCSTSIRKMFDELNEIDEVIPILKICSTSDNLRIVFDFNCKYVVDMVVETGSSSSGIVYPIEGFVYVGAKNHETEFCKVTGALIHELTHYAMQLTYENCSKPYEVGDNENSERFENVMLETIRICKENPSIDSIVRTVFKPGYGQKVWHQELIVRVPQLLAQYKSNSEALKAAEQNTPELFDFYRVKTLKDVAVKSEFLLQKCLISKINNQTGIARKIGNLNVQFETVRALDLKSLNVITSNAPQLTLAILRQALPADSHIFVTLEQVALGNILEKIDKVNAKESSTALIDCIDLTQEYPKSLRKLMKGIKNVKTMAFVMTEDESSKVKEKFPQIELKTFDHKWDELTEGTKVYLLNQIVIFQGFKMKLNKLVEPSSGPMNFFPLSKLLDCKDFKIGHELQQTSHKFYIPRKFIKKGQANARSFEELLQDESKTSAMIISDDAGSGKSVTLFEVAESLHVAYPDRWIQFVDLKRHIGSFKSIKNYENIESFEDFIAQIILKNESEFDRELFLQMFRAGKTFVLFDGFDEISPNYKDLLLHVLNLFQLGSGNQLHITTRPHLEADLEVVLGKFVFKLEEFAKESQMSFLAKYWQSVGFEISQEDFEILSHLLLQKFSKIAASKIVGLPLLIRMTAEIFEDPSKENVLHKVDSLSISSVFREFIEKYFLRWTMNDNEISQSESVAFVWAGGVLEFHHRIALNHIFDKEFVSLDVDESDAEKISRVGLIRYEKAEKTFQFIHETFAEYFVADFIWFHFNRKNSDPSHDCRRAVEVFIEVSYNVGFRVIRNFLDQTLETVNFSPSEVFCKSVAKCASKVVKSRSRYDFLTKSLRALPENLAILTMAIVKFVEKDVLLELLQSSTTDGNVLRSAADYGSNSIVSSLVDVITAGGADSRKEIYPDEVFKIVLRTAARNRNAKVLEKLCANMSSTSKEDEIKAMFQQKGLLGENVIHIAAEYSTDAVFLELVSLLTEYLSRDKIKSLLQAVNHRYRNFFQQAVIIDTSESLELKFDVLKANFDIHEQKAFFYQSAAALNIFQYAAQNQNEKIFETIIGATRKPLSLSDDDIKSMLMEKDAQGSNVIHIVALHGNTTVLKELNSLLRERFSDDEIRSLLCEVNSWEGNCFQLAENNTKINLKISSETIGNLLPVEDQLRLIQKSSQQIDIMSLACENYSLSKLVPVETIRELLTEKDPFGHNAFQKVAFSFNIYAWIKLVSLAKARFSDDEMKSFLLCLNAGNQNCLQIAVSGFSRENNTVAICETIKDVLCVDDQKKFARQKDVANRNVFHLATMSNKIFKYPSLCNGLSRLLSKEEIIEMLKEKDSDGNNILCSKRRYPINDKVCDLVTFLQQKLTNDEIKDLLFDVNDEGRNFFQGTVEFSEKLEIKALSVAIKGILSQDDQRQFFGIKSLNVFQLAARNPKNGIFLTLCECQGECLKSVFTDDEIKSFIQEKNSDNKNVLHLICHHLAEYNERHSHYISANDDSVKKLHDFLKILKEILGDADELKIFLTSSDNSGSNCLHLAAQFQGQLFLSELFNFVRIELGIEDLREAFQKCDIEGRNIFKCASFNEEVPEMLSFVAKFGREILDENQFGEMMMLMHQQS